MLLSRIPCSDSVEAILPFVPAKKCTRSPQKNAVHVSFFVITSRSSLHVQRLHVYVSSRLKRFLLTADVTATCSLKSLTNRKHCSLLRSKSTVSTLHLKPLEQCPPHQPNAEPRAGRSNLSKCYNEVMTNPVSNLLKGHYPSKATVLS